MAVEFQEPITQVITADSGITMAKPTGTSAGDLLIACITKDDDYALTPPAGDLWTVIQNVAAGTAAKRSYTARLWVGYRIAEGGDTEWTWTGDKEGYYGVILRYTGHDATPIHASGSGSGTSANPIAPSVGFENLAAGSLVLQVFGADDNDEPYTVPAPLIQRFKDSQATCGGAGGDRECIADAWDVSTAVYADKSKNVRDQEATPFGVAFSSDGTKMYIVGIYNNTVYQYTLSEAWDVSTAVYADKSKLVSDQGETYPRSVAFSSDGTKMYIVGTVNDTVYQYTLSEAWDVSTATYADKFKYVGEEPSFEEDYPVGVAFSSDGTKMYILGIYNNTVYQYTLDAWDVSTAVYADKSRNVSDQEVSPVGVAFSSDGTKMYIVGLDLFTVYQYTLDDWDVSTATYADKFKYVGDEDTIPYGVTFSSDGTKMYILGGANKTVYQYTVGVATGPATFTMNAIEEWAAVTVVIEALAIAGLSMKWNGVAISKWNGVVINKLNGVD